MKKTSEVACCYFSVVSSAEPFHAHRRVPKPLHTPKFEQTGANATREQNLHCEHSIMNLCVPYRLRFARTDQHHRCSLSHFVHPLRPESTILNPLLITLLLACKARSLELVTSTAEDDGTLHPLLQDKGFRNYKIAKRSV